MKLKATIEQINRYKVTIGDRTWDDFVKREEWEGMIKFSGPSGTLIVDNDEASFTSVFNRMFGSSGTNEDPVELVIYKASPNLLPIIKDEDIASKTEELR